MKIEYTEGCTCYGLNVDGEPFDDLDVVEKRVVFDRMVKAILKDSDIQDIIIHLLPYYGEYKHLFDCEECGYSVCSYTMKI